MGLSLRELKEQLMAKQGYTITPNHSQLNDLKALVDNMMGVRGAPPPSSGSGSYSGTNCIGHVVGNDYNLSLGGINALDIKGCSCHTVNDTTAYCSSRTYTCSCNSNTPTCTCNSRSSTTCDCQNRTSDAACDANAFGYPCSCRSRDPGCSGLSDVGEWRCVCQSRTSRLACTCDTRTPDPCTCRNRTSSCGSRNTTSCTCNGRCACNSEKRFG